VHKTIIVVPCYNEEQRLKEHEFLPLLQGADLLFVDDGSSDATPTLLDALQQHAGVHVLRLPQNGGKAEAVRRGMLRALELGAEVVGYMDADASTPAREMLRLLAALNERDVDVLLGARVQLLGNDVRRLAWRHYLGRVFATAASMVLQLPVYDTQCGAKLFRNTTALRVSLREPFHSRWVFDVELIARLLAGNETVPGLSRERFVEIPLAEWGEVAGSKLGVPSMLRSGVELLAIGAQARRARRRLRAN
jgi:glycosyltransferase involved in cell wall biosynthesis